MSEQKLTALGKYLRKLRIDRGERLLDMSRQLEISSAFLSAVEFGRKAPPQDLCSRIADLYNLNQKETEELIQAEDASRSNIRITASSDEGRQTAALLARHIERLSPDDLKKIRDIARKGNTN